MIADPGLESATEAFERSLTPIVLSLAGTVEGMDRDALTQDVTREAFHLASAFVDCDEVHTDAELWSLLVIFAPRLGGDLQRATPDDLRRSGLIKGRRTWLESPSALFDLLVRYDQRHGTGHARTYHDRAVAIAFAVAALDPYTTEVELQTIERFRATMAKAGGAAGPDGPAPGVPDPATLAGGAEGAGGAVEEELGPPRPIEELMAELDDLIGLEG